MTDDKKIVEDKKSEKVEPMKTQSATTDQKPVEPKKEEMKKTY